MTLILENGAFHLDRFQPADIQNMGPVQQNQGPIPRFDWDAIARTTECYTLRHGSRIVAMGGIAPLWYGRYQAWLYLSQWAEKRITSGGYAMLMHLARVIRGILDDAQRDPMARRVEATVLDSWPGAHQWARMLGFEMEGVARRYDPRGRDFALYARIRE